MSRRDGKRKAGRPSRTRRAIFVGGLTLVLLAGLALGVLQAMRVAQAREEAAALAREEAAKAAAAAADAALPSFTATLAPSSAVDQGDFLAVLVKIKPGRVLTSVDIEAFGTKVAAFPVDQAGAGTVAYYASFAVGRAREPGQFSVDLRVLDSRGVEGKEAIPFTVREKKFSVQRMTVTGDNAALASDDEAWAEDSRKVNAAKAAPIAQALWDGPFIEPLKGEITTEFGEIRLVNGVETSRHSGLDLAAEQGDPVQAANTGVVVFAGPLPISGTTVIIDHGLNYFSSYNHLSRLSVDKGDRVTKGQEIGLVGSTGFSTGPHLHWTMTVGLTAVNPWLFVDSQPPGPLPGD